MTTIASQITSLSVVYSTVYSDADQRKHQSSASLAFVWGIHRDRWIPRTKGQLRGKCFHLMTSSCIAGLECKELILSCVANGNQNAFSILLPANLSCKFSPAPFSQWLHNGLTMHGIGNCNIRTLDSFRIVWIYAWMFRCLNERTHFWFIDVSVAWHTWITTRSKNNCVTIYLANEMQSELIFFALQGIQQSWFWFYQRNEYVLCAKNRFNRMYSYIQNIHYISSNKFSMAGVKGKT